jgi:hypothetical protein
MSRRASPTPLLLAIFLLASPALATISYTPSSPNVDQTTTFALSTSSGTIDEGSIQWRFGDGTTAAGRSMVQKEYARAGIFTVQCHYYYSTFSSGFWVDESATVTVVENRRITATPANPQMDQSVTFQAVNFLSASVLWSYGDDTPSVLGGTTIQHAYTRPGVFIASAKDKGGAGLAALTTTVSVAVDISSRRITFTPVYPAASLPMTFNAVDFFTAQIRWDFGDGTAAVSGGAAIAHTFARSGSYTVQAWDWNGAYGGPTSALVRVGEPTGPGAPFHISFLQLRFADGLAYKVVPRDAAGLLAYADIKYEGTGLFQAQWLLDGMPFRALSQVLSFAEASTLDSGRIPALPTQMTGMHEVSLRILAPETSLTMPVIRYFVSADAEVPPLHGLGLELASVEGLKGVTGELRLDSLKIPAGAYFILNGSVIYTQAAAVRFGLLRIHLGQELVDQQILRDLKPGETRRFATSILNPSPEAKFVYLTLYDISDPDAPRLLYLKKIAVLPNS